ncbi:MAG: hypothetical protein HZC42_05800 [Candidatus Eisenbacteria bacterium]|nr:hypothetical protein [Candidatus Eisenbacteria bacterium]
MSAAPRALLAAALATTLVPAIAPAAARAVEWSTRASVDGGYTSEVFPGYAGSTPDRFALVTAGTSARIRPLEALRLEWLAGVTAERYDRWQERDVERYETELRARLGGWRLRARGRATPQLMLYPDALGGARYGGREGLLGLDWRFARALVASLELRSDGQRYDELHAERTQVRTRWGYQLAWEPRSDRRFAAQFENERARADDPNYDFYDNQLTLAGGTRVGPVLARVEAAFGLRNYFPASIFTSNYRRQDRAQAWRLELRRDLGGPLTLVARDEYRRRDSTRRDRDYRVNTVGLALDWRLGR